MTEWATPIKLLKQTKVGSYVVKERLKDTSTIGNFRRHMPEKWRMHSRSDIKIRVRKKCAHVKNRLMQNNIH